MTKEIHSKDKPHADIGKQKFRVKRYYTAWVEYDVVADSKDEAENAVIEQGGIEEIKWAEGYHKDEPVEVYANDYNSDYNRDTERAWKVAECVPYRDRDGVYYDDPEWSTNEFEWTKTGDEETEAKTNNNMEVPF
tara:strand:+ start:31 stop:435 length:405 start_codon:yes stop_codon:yes gene_type:complete